MICQLSLLCKNNALCKSTVTSLLFDSLGDSNLLQEKMATVTVYFLKSELQ